MPGSARTQRAPLNWLPRGFDLEFLLRESRPTSLHDLVGRDNRAWRQLFAQWLAGTPEYGENTSTRFWAIAQAYDASGWRAVRSMAPDGAWAPRIKAFRDVCQSLRDELKARREDIAKRNKKLSRRELDEQATREWSATEDVARLGGPNADVAALARLEAGVISRTRQIKPLIMTAYQKYQEAVRWEEGNREKAMNAFATAHGHLSSAEAELRRATQEIRKAGAESRDPSAAQIEAIGEAWTSYLNGWTELIHATVQLGEVYVAWARKDTKKKITENFAAVHPLANGCLVAVHTLLLAFRTTLVATELASLPLTAGVSTEVIGILNSAMSLAAEFADRLIKSAVATSDAGNDEVVEEHLGRRYRRAGAGDPDDDSPGYLGAVLEGVTAALPKAVETTAKSAMHLATSATQKATVMRSLPLVGEFLTGAGLLVKWHDQLFPKELERKGSAERDRLIEAFRHAREWLNDHNVQVEEATVHKVLEDGVFEVSFGEVRGVMRDGRFSPDNPHERAAAVVASWRRFLGNRTAVTIEGGQYQLLTGHDDGFDWNLVPEFLVEEKEGAFVFVLPACPVRQRTARVAVRATVLVEGEGRLELLPAPETEFDLSALSDEVKEVVEVYLLENMKYFVDMSDRRPIRCYVELAMPGCVTVHDGDEVLTSYLVPVRAGDAVIHPLGLDAEQWSALLHNEAAFDTITQIGLRDHLYAKVTGSGFYVVNEQEEPVWREWGED